MKVTWNIHQQKTDTHAIAAVFLLFYIVFFKINCCNNLTYVSCQHLYIGSETTPTTFTCSPVALNNNNRCMFILRCASCWRSIHHTTKFILRNDVISLSLRRYIDSNNSFHFCSGYSVMLAFNDLSELTFSLRATSSAFNTSSRKCHIMHPILFLTLPRHPNCTASGIFS